MGTLTVTYDGTSKDYTMSGAPVVAYGGKTLLSSGGWSGTKTLKCGGQWMTTDVTVGARTLKTAGTLAKTDIQLKYTVNSTVKYQTITASGTFTVPSGSYNRAQFFAVGGGAGGFRTTNTKELGYGGGGGGGYTKTSSALATSSGTKYTVTIGAGGAANASGNVTSVQDSSGTTLISANGGTCSGNGHWVLGWALCIYDGGNGGSGGGAGQYWYEGSSSKHPYANEIGGGSNGGNGLTTTSYDYSVDDDGVDTVSIPASGGTGQGTSTIFNQVTYAGGGGGCRGYVYSSSSNGWRYLGSDGGGSGAVTYRIPSSYNSKGLKATNGTANTGGGGGGGFYYAPSSTTYSQSAGSGGSGVVIVKLWEV